MTLAANNLSAGIVILTLTYHRPTVSNNRRPNNIIAPKAVTFRQKQLLNDFLSFLTISLAKNLLDAAVRELVRKLLKATILPTTL